MNVSIKSIWYLFMCYLLFTTIHDHLQIFLTVSVAIYSKFIINILKNTANFFDCSVIPTGHYLYMETSGLKPKGWKAWLIGPPISPQSGKCFQFWYHMYGNSIGQLNVYLLTTKTVPSVPAWSRSQNQGNQWYIAQVSITQNSIVNVSSTGSTESQEGHLISKHQINSVILMSIGCVGFETGAYFGSSHFV